MIRYTQKPYSDTTIMKNTLEKRKKGGIKLKKIRTQTKGANGRTP